MATKNFTKLRFKRNSVNGYLYLRMVHEHSSQEHFTVLVVEELKLRVQGSNPSHTCSVVHGKLPFMLPET